MRCHLTLALALTAGLACACSNKLSGDLTVDGKPFVAKSCRSGQVSGFAGVDLLDESGRKLRLVLQPDGRAETLLFAAGAAVGERLGTCGPLTLTTQSSTINDVRNVKGSASLECERARGSVTFENCH